MKIKRLDEGQKRALAVATVLALLFGAYFLRGFFMLIAIAAIAAYLFAPLHQRLSRRMKPTSAALLTLVISLLVVILPMVLVMALAVYQITHTVNDAADSLSSVDLSKLGSSLIDMANSLLDKFPFIEYEVTPESLTDTVVTIAQGIGDWLLTFITSAVPSVLSFITLAIIYVYVFVSLLINRSSLIEVLNKLNPLGEQISKLYLEKMGAMVKGTVKGQFVIAVCQGVAGAISIYLAGFQDAFFIFVILLSALSIIPLGSGIITIPLGIAMAAFGNVGGGIFVIAWHLLVTTNIDNVLRPMLVPPEARLDPALMLLAVFAGISMFGFWGIVIGPVIMILIVTTIKVYLQVYRGMEFSDPPRKKRRLLGLVPLRNK